MTEDYDNERSSADLMPPLEKVDVGYKEKNMGMDMPQQQSFTFAQNNYQMGEGRMTAGASATPGEKNNEQKQAIAGLDASTFLSQT